MRARNLALVLFALGAAGAAAFVYFGSKRELPPTLDGAYGGLAAIASSASEVLAPAPSAHAAEPPDAGGAAPAPRVTQAEPLSSAQLGAPLVHGRFVTDCGAPDDMKVVVKVTVRKGRAVAVVVTTKPKSPAVAACVQKATRAKEWDISPATQHATVTY